MTFYCVDLNSSPPSMEEENRNSEEDSYLEEPFVSFDAVSVMMARVRVEIAWKSRQPGDKTGTT